MLSPRDSGNYRVAVGQASVYMEDLQLPMVPTAAQGSPLIVQGIGAKGFTPSQSGAPVLGWEAGLGP